MDFVMGHVRGGLHTDHMQLFPSLASRFITDCSEIKSWAGLLAYQWWSVSLTVEYAVGLITSLAGIQIYHS
jgi:hypothetical protein